MNFLVALITWEIDQSFPSAYTTSRVPLSIRYNVLRPCLKEAIASIFVFCLQPFALMTSIVNLLVALNLIYTTLTLLGVLVLTKPTLRHRLVIPWSLYNQKAISSHSIVTLNCSFSEKGFVF